MKIQSYISLIFGLLVLSACNPSGEERFRNMPARTAEVDTTPKVTGIGGIFFSSEDPEKIKAWYGSHLGLAIDEYGSPFEFRNANRKEELNYLRWSPFKKTSTYLQPSTKEFMINYRVQNLEGLLRQFKKQGVQVLDSVQTYDYGKFLHILDPEGNKIELWEPVDSVLTRLGDKTTK